MAAQGELKRPRGSPTGLTPLQASKKPAQRTLAIPSSRRNLAASYAQLAPPESDAVPATAWSFDETLALVEFMVCHERFKFSWPRTTDMNLWNRVAASIQEKTKTTVSRTGIYNNNTL